MQFLIVVLISLFLFSCKGAVNTKLDLPCNSGDIEQDEDNFADLDFEDIDIISDFDTNIDDEESEIIVIQKGTDKNDWAFGITADNYGGIFICGRTEGTFENNVSYGSSDYFLMKFNQKGEYLWTKSWGTPQLDIAYSIAADNDGYVYITGFENGLKLPIFGDMMPETSEKNGQLFVAKYDNDGNEIFKKYFGSSDKEYSVFIAVSEDKFCTTGWTYGIIDGNINKGVADSFISCFDKSGNMLWSRQWGGSGIDLVYSLAFDSKGNIFVTGTTASSIDGEKNLGSGDIFVTKFDNNGNYLWTKLFGTTNIDIGFSVFVLDDNSIFISGSTQGNFPGFQLKGLSDSFIIKLDSDGSIIWLKQYGSSDIDITYSIYASGKNIFTTGTFSGVYKNSSKGLNDIFFAKFDELGSEKDVLSWGSYIDDQGRTITGKGKNIYLTGWAQEKLGLGMPTGIYDIFFVVLKNYITTQ